VSKSKKIIVRVKGGLGNQLFIYATAFRLAMYNHVELVIDSQSGFIRDKKYCRKYMLDHFGTSARLATKQECLFPFERYRRYILKWQSKYKEFYKKKYIEQDTLHFDDRLLFLNIKNTTYLDGYWQSEKYFVDIDSLIRKELEIIPPKDVVNHKFAKLISKKNSVCIHVRWFDKPDGISFNNNVDVDYYQKALAYILKNVDCPYFFIFSDFPDETQNLLNISTMSCTYIKHNKEDDMAYADLWLMSLCRHFIIANSTFSWWGAWLSNNPHKIVVAPRQQKNAEGAWGFEGLIPMGWISL